MVNIWQDYVPDSEGDDDDDDDNSVRGTVVY